MVHSPREWQVIRQFINVVDDTDASVFVCVCVLGLPILDGRFRYVAMICKEDR